MESKITAESIPPDKKTPNGTSEINLLLTALPINSFTWSMLENSIFLFLTSKIGNSLKIMCF